MATIFHAAALALALVFAAVEVARVPIPLPLPARSPDVLFQTLMVEPPPGALPPRLAADPRPPADTSGADRLRASARLFAGGPIRGGVETVAVTRDGRGLAMVDGRGRLWRAVRRDAGGSGQRRPPAFELSPALPLANLTPGLTTGAGLSPDGRAAYFANAPLGLVRVDLPPWEDEEGEDEDEGGKGGRGGKAARRGKEEEDAAAIPRVTFLANRVDSDDPLAPGAELLFPDGLDVFGGPAAAAAGGAPEGGGKKNGTTSKGAKTDGGSGGGGGGGNDDDDYVVYFSSATDIPPLRLSADNAYDGALPALLALCQGAPRGMLLAHHPRNGSTRALVGPGGATAADPTGASSPAGGLWFANGVAAAHDGRSVLVADSVQAAVRRYWLSGPKAGSLETFAERLPGLPDGVSRASDGRSYWVTIFSPMPPPVRWSHVRLVRAMMAWAPAALRPRARREGTVLRLDGETGAVLEVYADAGGRGGVWAVTSAVEAANAGGGGLGGWLLLGSLHEEGIRVVRAEEAGAGGAVGRARAAPAREEEDEDEDEGATEEEEEDEEEEEEEDEYADHDEL